MELNYKRPAGGARRPYPVDIIIFGQGPAAGRAKTGARAHTRRSWPLAGRICFDGREPRESARRPRLSHLAARAPVEASGRPAELLCANTY